MNFEDIGRVWREQETGDFRRRRVESLSVARGRAEGLLGRIHRAGTRNVTITLLLCVPLFTWGVLMSQRPWLAGTGVAILWTLLIAGLRLVRSFRTPGGGAPLPVRAAVESEVRRLRLLERFWGRVHWFFLAFLVGEVLAFEGFRPPAAERGPLSGIFYTGLIMIVALGTVGRRRDARVRVRPLREELESWLAGLETFDYDFDGGAGPQGGTQ